MPTLVRISFGAKGAVTGRFVMGGWPVAFKGQLDEAGVAHFSDSALDSVNRVAETSPPITTVANGFCTSEPGAVDKAIGANPNGTQGPPRRSDDTRILGIAGWLIGIILD